jgi:NTP pyrophosphatase (non-canonical NTP hydrolase)
MDDSISHLTDAAIRFRDERDWAQFHRPKDLAMGLSIEAGELCELFLWKTDPRIADQLRDPAFLERVAEEIADVQIFVLYLCHGLGIALPDAVHRKLEQNARKYPVERARGNARKYSDPP